jgi:uncharacterized protein (TIGR02271 family)
MHDSLTEIEQGWTVEDRSGEKIGDIDEIGEGYVVVQKGLIFPKDVYIPADAIETVDRESGHIRVSADKDGIDGMGWDAPPAGGSMQSDRGYIGYDDSDATRGTTGSTGSGYADSTTGYADTASGGTGTMDRETRGRDADTIDVPVHEEELVAERRQRETGEVRVEKDVVEEQAELDVPVTRDEVTVNRKRVDREATGDETAFTDGDTIRVPVTAEEVDVQKRDRVVEEIEISKRPVTETERVTDTVRREEVRVDDDAARRDR